MLRISYHLNLKVPHDIPFKNACFESVQVESSYLKVPIITKNMIINKSKKEGKNFNVLCYFTAQKY